MRSKKFIKSEARACELDEQDYIEVGGLLFEVTKTNLNAYGQIILDLRPADEPEVHHNILVVSQHFLFTIYNRKPSKKK